MNDSRSVMQKSAMRLGVNVVKVQCFDHSYLCFHFLRLLAPLKVSSLFASMLFPSFLELTGSSPALELQNLNLKPAGTPRKTYNSSINIWVFKQELMFTF